MPPLSRMTANPPPPRLPASGSVTASANADGHRGVGGVAAGLQDLDADVASRPAMPTRPSRFLPSDGRPGDLRARDRRRDQERASTEARTGRSGASPCHGDTMNSRDRSKTVEGPFDHAMDG